MRSRRGKQDADTLELVFCRLVLVEAQRRDPDALALVAEDELRDAEVRDPVGERNGPRAAHPAVVCETRAVGAIVEALVLQGFAERTLSGDAIAVHDLAVRRVQSERESFRLGDLADLIAQQARDLARGSGLGEAPAERGVGVARGVLAADARALLLEPPRAKAFDERALFLGPPLAQTLLFLRPTPLDEALLLDATPLQALLELRLERRELLFDPSLLLGPPGGEPALLVGEQLLDPCREPRVLVPSPLLQIAFVLHRAVGEDPLKARFLVRPPGRDA